MSWESTRSYYSLFNQLTSERMGPWHQPRLLVDSIDFSEIVALQNVGDWKGAGAVLADSARRLQAGGATVLGIGANTMHKSFDDVARAVTIPVLDIRDAIVEQLARMNVGTFSLLGTKYLMEGDFYSAHLERRGVKVVKPDDDEIQELQHMIYAELTQGVVSESSRNRFLSIAEGCRARGGEVVGLCCTEFGLYVDDRNALWPFIDSTRAHVEALLDF
jgi:aspartate racemase